MSKQAEPKPKAMPSPIVNPKLWPDPDQIRFQQLYKYQSIDMVKIAQSVRNYKRSAFYIGGILAGCFVMKALVDGAVNQWIFGENGNGGEFLTMWTTNTTSDYYYNREFQRMRYLNEEPSGDDPFMKVRDQQLVDLGYKWNPLGTNAAAQKKSPHYKYY